MFRGGTEGQIGYERMEILGAAIATGLSETGTTQESLACWECWTGDGAMSIALEHVTMTSYVCAVIMRGSEL